MRVWGFTGLRVHTTHTHTAHNTKHKRKRDREKERQRDRQTHRHNTKVIETERQLHDTQTHNTTYNTTGIHTRFFNL